MAKKLLPVVLAVISGCACAFIIFSNVEKTSFINPKGNVIAIQLGVFKDEESAVELSNKYGGKVFQDEDLYRVYYSILNKDENIEFFVEYLDSIGTSYYLKSLNVSEKSLKEGLEYEKVMLKMNLSNKLDINKELLEFYQGVV